MTDLLRPAHPGTRNDPRQHGPRQYDPRQAGPGRAVRAGHRLRPRHLAWPLFALAFGWYLWTYGLPYANDVVFCWLIGALVAASVHSGGRRGWPLVLRDWVPVMAVVWVYSLLRGYGAHTPWPVRYEPQLSIDTFLGGGETWTVRLQHWLYTPGHPHWYDYSAVTVYMSHFFTVFLVLAVLWKRRYPSFRRLLALYLAVTFAGFATYVLYPADPPWLTGQEGHMPAVTRIVSDVLNQSGLPRAGSVFENGSEFANDVAAMPSLHAAYPMLLALFFWRGAGRWTRVLLAAYPLAMAFTLVYGAEHFIVDILAGWAYAVVLWYVLTRVLDRRARARAERARRATTAPAGPVRVPADGR
ncbi:phosphatase PAP2 family protein [Kitasatospora sp. NPDC048540]|uniref:phosphatase PAP2 family protein n=1 Tax=unclassified Kitasatospora TaxID=2633591 RepID=UPI0006903007|nr:phosphatase PAP2 family protein [Kitasatospora sp. MBT63]